MNQCTIDILKMIISREESKYKIISNIGLKLQDIKPILASQYIGLTVDEMYSKVKGNIENLQITSLIWWKLYSINEIFLKFLFYFWLRACRLVYRSLY